LSAVTFAVPAGVFNFLDFTSQAGGTDELFYSLLDPAGTSTPIIAQGDLLALGNHDRTGAGVSWNLDTTSDPSLAQYIGLGMLNLVYDFSHDTASDFFSVNCEGAGCTPELSITYDYTPAAVSQTPLPAALPLFSAGLGVLGLFGWRRKRKNIAAIAAA
jgi:hypothetical protein